MTCGRVKSTGTGFRDCADRSGQPDNDRLAALQLPAQHVPKSELKRLKLRVLVSGIAPTALANLTMTGSLPSRATCPKVRAKKFKTTVTVVSGIAPTALANLTMTGSLPYNFPPNMTPTMGARDASQSLDQSSGYPSPRHLTQPFSTAPAKQCT